MHASDCSNTSLVFRSYLSNPTLSGYPPCLLRRHHRFCLRQRLRSRALPTFVDAFVTASRFCVSLYTILEGFREDEVDLQSQEADVSLSERRNKYRPPSGGEGEGVWFGLLGVLFYFIYSSPVRKACIPEKGPFRIF